MVRRGVLRLSAGFALLFILMTGALSHASAGTGTSAIIIHNRICPTGYAGNDIFGTCHGNPQDSHLDFTIEGPVTETFATGDDGNVAFQVLPAGTYNISGGVPGEFASTVVYCSVQDEPDNQVPATQTDIGYSIELADDTTVICDWYNIPEDLSGNTPTPAPTSTPTVTLPNTGAGSGSGLNNTLPFFGFVFAALGLTAYALRRRAAR
jgi:hypothetical protein